MRISRRAPIRRRLTLASLVGLTVVVTALSWFVYVRTNNNLLDTIDAGLRSRSEVLAVGIRTSGPRLPNVRPTLLESDEDFAQISDATGRMLDSSPIVSGAPLVPPTSLAGLQAPAFFDERVVGIDNFSRVLAAPVETAGHRYILLVGGSLQDRRDEVLQLAATLAISGFALLLLAGFGAWWLIGAALEPVERMRRQAEAITSAEPSDRLTVAEGDDEIARLGATLNAMLDRVEGAVTRERQLIDRASHELRTPLAIQRVDLDLALSGPQTIDELVAALRSASEENAHLARVAEDLLVLSRARGGELAVNRREVSLGAQLDDAVARNRPRALSADVRLASNGPDVSVSLDPDWIRQALDDLLDNALRSTPAKGKIGIFGAVQDGHILIGVEDSGHGFDASFLPHAFDPFTSGGGPHDRVRSAGLGLTIVRAIAEAHGGTATAENTDRGARITLTLPRGAAN
jgi:two-component system, OmpR family, sensor kinase